MKPRKFRKKIIELQTKYKNDPEAYYSEERELVLKFLYKLGYTKEVKLLNEEGGGWFYA